MLKWIGIFEKHSKLGGAARLIPDYRLPKEILDSDNAYDLGKVIFKCVDSDFMCQYIKYYYNEPIEERDLVFDYKGKVATFNYPIANPFKA